MSQSRFTWLAGATAASVAALCMGIGAQAAPLGSNPICNRLGHIGVSAGVYMYCHGPQQIAPQVRLLPALIHFGTNVDAADPHEDIAPDGVQAYGQSETSIAAAGRFVVEAWNDATAFFSPCPSPRNKQEGTGFGFSNDGGKTFTDLGGVPNAFCGISRTEGDPSVEVYQHNGNVYFYISSIFVPFGVPQNALSVTACKVTSGGSALSCSNPIIAAVSSDCGTSQGLTACSFLDKEFLSVDPARGRLYMSYTEFGPFPTSPTVNGQIDLAVCDISKTPDMPSCSNGGSGAVSKPYLVIARQDADCESEGSYPAVNLYSGSVYVAWEFNWATNVFGPAACFSKHTQNRIAYVSPTCLTFPTTSCSHPGATAGVNIASMAAAAIPGYNRFPMNDFPRIAVSNDTGLVSIVWNDARYHPAGDILLQSFALASLQTIQRVPIRINSNTGGWHFLPALRNNEAGGKLNVSFYGRSQANTALTDIYAALDIDPRITTPPISNALVTTGPSDWNAVSSNIVPNFGDYTDNYIAATAQAPFVGDTLYVAWSDGRLGDPQPFEDHR